MIYDPETGAPIGDFPVPEKPRDRPLCRMCGKSRLSSEWSMYLKTCYRCNNLDKLPDVPIWERVARAEGGCPLGQPINNDSPDPR